ncbi:hypothetical protein J4461_02590 [Candidatus Pacearchaeota archaeon]|nr:hypothetical protein [Candidatus Pacearchaeota archaeon]
MDSYSRLVERIAQSAGVSSDDIERKVEAKRAKLSGLVSKEGAAQIVGAELGVNLEKERLKIAELLPSMKRAHVCGKIVRLFPVRSYSKNGREGKVANFVLADDSGNIRVVLWDAHHISLLEAEEFKQGDSVEISNAMMRNGELHLSAFGDLKSSNEKFVNAVTETVFHEKSLKDAQPGQKLQSRAFIVQVFEPRYFEVCPQCGKKVVEQQCNAHGKVEPQRRALLNLVIDDGTGSLRSVIFGEQILKLGLNQEEVFSLELFNEKKNSLLGDEKIFSGNIRTNSLYNTTEFTIELIQEVEPEKILNEMNSRL